MDASPLLGAREFEDTAARPRGPEGVAEAEQADIALQIRVVALVDRNNTPSSQLLNQHSGAHQSQLSLFSPLVLAPTATNTPLPAAATVVAIGDGATTPPAHTFALRVGLRKTTVEDLARAIEATYSSQALTGGSLLCAALFRGDQPLLFGSRVRDVLREGDSVVVYGSICKLIGSESRSSRRRSDIGGDIYQSTTCLPLPNAIGGNESPPPLPHAAAAFSYSPAAVAARQTLAATDMTRVGELVSRAPLKARFINVLIHPVLLRGFLEFCALPSELALESLLFVLDVERFRHVQPSMARLLANYIYLSYVAPSSPLRINVSSQMRERIPWPFLPGWEYNPWVFDEILASVGFTLKKHTLLRFERSPVGLAALMDSEGFSASEYTKPLRFDLEFDPMVAIADTFEPDIDVVIWVNDLDFDPSGTKLVASLSQLAPGFRQQLLERVCAQFVDQHRASALCDGYFHLVTHIKPLQKQRRIKKTRKIRNFFGDNPHEALLRQQLMAVVPPSSQMSAARAAAELMARKKTTEVESRAAGGRHCRHDSATSSVLAEQQLLAIDSDSDIEDEHAHGWATKAMMVVGADTPPPPPPKQQPRVRSWSDSDDSDSKEHNGRWDSDDNGQHAPSTPAVSRRGLGVYGNDQVLCRALSMIGVSQLDSQDSSSSAQSSPREAPAVHLDSPIRPGGGLASSLSPSLQHLLPPAPQFSYSVYSAHAHSLPSSIGRADGKGKGSERKKRVNRLREFFGRSEAMAPSIAQLASLQMVPAAGGGHHHQLPQGLSSEAWNDTTRSNISTSTCEDASGDKSALLSSEQRNLLVRRRRKLKALLGEQVEETIVGHAGSNSNSASMERVMLTPEPSLTAPSTLSSVESAGFSKSSHLESATLMGAISEEQRVRARWRRNKLVTMLGDVPTDVTTVYRTDPIEQNKSDSEDADTLQQQSANTHMQQRQRARKLRHFFGQSLGPDAILQQSNKDDKGREPQPDILSSAAIVAAQPTPVSDIPSEVDDEEETSSYEFVPPKGTLPTNCWEHAVVVLPDLQPPNRAQFWMTTSSASSPESQASILANEKTNRRASLIASLRARKASIIGSIKRATPSTSSLVGGTPQTPPRSLLSNKPTSESQLRGLCVKPLSPLPAISPNNFQASFDRGMALREVVAVAEYIAGNNSPCLPPPRVSSSAAAAVGSDRSDYDHRRVISSALLASSQQDTRSRPALEAARIARPIQPKSVHWFDSPQVGATRRRSPSKASPNCGPPLLPVSFVPAPLLLPCPPPPPNSAKTSLDLSMSIVLRSPSATKSAIKSPIISPQSTAAPLSPPQHRLPTPPLPPPPPRMALTHKASITAVGGHNNRSNIAIKAADPVPPATPLAQPVTCYNNIVTIRPRRSQSFAISRKLERATTGRKRSHTIGSGRQAASRSEAQTKDGGSSGGGGVDAIPRADKPSRRVQSMIVATQFVNDTKQPRSRCVTVIPLRLELQRLLAAKLASMGKPHSVTPFRISAASGLNTINELDEYLGTVPEQTPLANTPEMSRLQSIQLTTDALCGASNANRVVAKQAKVTTVRGRSKSWQLPNANSAKLGFCRTRRRPRSQSCPGKLVTTRFKRTLPPIQPALVRYLSSANASRSLNTSPTKRGLVHMSAPYHRISLALLSRPASQIAATASGNRLEGRHSLDNRQPIKGMSLNSPPTPSSLRRFASVDAKLSLTK
ncbi:hypothetical protein GGI21_000380 [Coemansia aciculifera]|nr:hypothetical protein GGI21_000380 [Coemansia aciculifera]